MANVFQYNQNVYILEAPVAYRKEVVRYLDLVRSTYTGRTLLRHIYARGRKLLILPYQPDKDGAGPVNAFAQADNPRAGTTKNFPMMTPIDIPNWGTLMIPTAQFGTGAGSTVTLKYHPAIYRQLIKNKGRIDPGDGPGEVLFHEMLHAMRMMYGKMLSTTVVEDPHMDDFEEFVAILAANMYRSERGFKQMRQNHWGHKPLPKDLNDSAAYYSHFDDEIERWFNSQKQFCLDMAASQAAFNPMKYAASGLGLNVVTPMAI